MKITFVQSEKEAADVDKVIRDGLKRRKVKVGTWILPPSLSKGKPDTVIGKPPFTVIDSPDGREVHVESFSTIDGALLYALGINSDGNPIRDWDYEGALKYWGSFV